MPVDNACGNGRATYAERGHDLYETPAVAVESLLRELPLPRRLWEPACGPGAIARVLRAAGHEVLATDLVDYASPDQDASGWDFTMPQPVGSHHADAIVTNPPFKLASEFVARGLQHAPMVVMLLRLAFLESERRSDILDNGMLAEILCYRKRLPMMHRAGYRTVAMCEIDPWRRERLRERYGC